MLNSTSASATMDFDCGVICASNEDCESLKSLVESLGDFPRAVEVGSWTGKTALAMAEVGAHVVCVDTWEGSPGDTTLEVISELGGDAVFERFSQNVKAYYPKRIVPFRATSRYAAKVLKGTFDLIFLDGAHDYDSVKEDIRAWWPHVRRGGILAGHDMHPAEGGVWRAVIESGPYESMPTSIWVRRKPEAPKTQPESKK